MQTIRYSQPSVRNMFVGGSLRVSGVLSPYAQMIDMSAVGTRRDTKLFLAIMNVNALVAGIVNDFSGDVFASVLFYDTSNNYQQEITMSLTVSDIMTLGLNATVAAAIAVAATSNSYTVLQIAWSAAAETIRSDSSLSLSVQTSTGAVGTLVSAVQDAFVMVDLSSITTASIAGNAAVDLVLEVAPTNSATAGDWVVKGRSGNAQTLSLAITLQSIQTVKGQTIAYVPKGYYVKVRSTGVAGTVTTSVVEARAVLL